MTSETVEEVKTIPIAGSTIELDTENRWWCFLKVNAGGGDAYYLALRPECKGVSFFPPNEKIFSDVASAYGELTYRVSYQLMRCGLAFLPPYVRTTLHSHNMLSYGTVTDESLQRIIVTRFLLGIISGDPRTSCILNYIEIYYEDIQSSRLWVSYLVEFIAKHSIVGAIAVWYGDGIVSDDIARILFRNLMITKPFDPTPTERRLVSLDGFGLVYGDEEKESDIDTPPHIMKSYKAFMDEYKLYIPKGQTTIYIGEKTDPYMGMIREYIQARMPVNPIMPMRQLDANRNGDNVVVEHPIDNRYSDERRYFFELGEGSPGDDY